MHRLETAILISDMSSFPERIETRADARFYVSDDGDLYALREMYEMNVYGVTIKPDMLVLDIGAHKGIFAIWAAKQGAEVVAYEPNPSSYAVLLRNLALNKDIKVYPHQLGVWGQKSTLLFYPDNENSIGSSLFPERLGNVVPIHVDVEAFDTILGDREWDIIKIDAEEAEYNILLSSNKLDQIKSLTMEWHCPEGQRDCPDLYKTINKLSKFFDVPLIDYDWRALVMKRKHGL